MSRLCSYTWPGNIRELENVIERSMIFNDGPLDANNFEFEFEHTSAGATTSPQQLRPLPEIAQEAIRDAEIKAIFAVLAQTNGNKSQAARLLGVSYKTLLNKVKEYGIEADQV